MRVPRVSGPRTLKIKDQTVQTTLKSLWKQRACGHFSNVFASFQKNFKKEPNQVITGKITEKDQRYFDRNEQTLNWEFDPGSGWTLAACLTHASRAELFQGSFRMELKWLSGGRVSNAWVTCLIQGDNSRKRLLIPHKRTVLHSTVWKTPVVWDGPASD